MQTECSWYFFAIGDGARLDTDILAQHTTAACVTASISQVHQLWLGRGQSHFRSSIASGHEKSQSVLQLRFNLVCEKAALNFATAVVLGVSCHCALTKTTLERHSPNSLLMNIGSVTACAPPPAEIHGVLVDNRKQTVGNSNSPAVPRYLVRRLDHSCRTYSLPGNQSESLNALIYAPQF